MRDKFTNPGSSAAPRGECNSRISMRSGLLALLCSIILAIGLTACPSQNHHVVSSSPNITSLNPNAGAVAAPVTITGTNFGATQGTSTVTFNGTAATPTSWSPTSIAAPVPAGATTGNVVVTVGGLASNGVNFTVGSNSQTADVATWHYDNSRSGLNPSETTLTPTNVKSTTFGKVAQFTVDGSIDGQILYLSQLAVPGVGTKNVVYAATENDSVYAIDADSITGTSATVLWKKRSEE